MEGRRDPAFVVGNAEEDRSRAEAKQVCEIREVQFDQDLSTILPGWKACNARFTDHMIVCDPEWLQERFKQEHANLRAYLLERDSEVIGAIALEFSRHRLACRLGNFKVPNLPVKVFRVLGYTPNMPAEESAHNLLFQRLLDLEFDAIYMSWGVRTDSFFWQYLHSSPLIKKHFRFYSELGVRPHPVIRMTGSFDDYLRKFSSKTRKHFSQYSRKLREHGEVELVRVTEEPQVNSFVEAAAEISRKTYQFRVLGVGIRNLDKLKTRLKWAAQQGWLRSYLLKCGAVPCAFQVAYQYNRTLLVTEVGYDPAWSKLNVGTTQQLLALQDLFKENKPDACDFGAYAEYKEFLGNEAYSDVIGWLFRRQPYPLFALNSYRLSIATSRAAGNVLRRLNLKSKIRRLLRKQ